MKKRTQRFLALLTAGAMLAAGLSACGGKTQQKQAASSAAVEETEFVPRLDTETPATLEIAGAFGNFEALDQVINAFNEYYPNVTVTYEQASGSKLVDYLRNNTYTDIFMTSDTNLHYPDWEDYYVLDRCADLAAEDIDISAVRSDLLPGSTFDGKLANIPMGLMLNGLVVNKTLLEKEGLSVPTDYEEFLTVLEALKQKGYTPIQGPDSAVYSALIYNMGMDLIGTDAGLLTALNNGDEAAVEKLTPVFERLQTLIDKGYIDPEVNAEYPSDNYDGAILKFFEGDVPFWACNTEKVSGMKKRESKSETFSASPFEYEFMYAPMGDDGAYAFEETWVGFSVNKNSDAYDYAVEFIRFLAQGEQLNTIAEIKGVPSVTTTSTDERYTGIAEQKKAQTFVNDGTLMNHIKDYFSLVAVDLGRGDLESPEAAARDYVERCAATTAEMATRENQ